MNRMFQFSLKSLLILMLAVAAFFGGWAAARFKNDQELQQALREYQTRQRTPAVDISPVAPVPSQPPPNPGLLGPPPGYPLPPQAGPGVSPPDATKTPLNPTGVPLGGSERPPNP